MDLHTINTGTFKLDGGTVFGILPKSIWNKTNPADENNLCSWAMRCLLIEEGKKLILVDTGIGNKQNHRISRRLGLKDNESLEILLRQLGFTTNDVTDVFLSHLHFDHCGGSVRYNEAKNRPELTFKNAIHWSNETHWNWAINPNVKEKDSFLQENISLIKETGQLKFIRHGDELSHAIRIKPAYGHTEYMMLPYIQYKGKTVVFVADLIPSVGHIALPAIASYDIRPLTSISEKQVLLNEAAANEYILFFEHDHKNECCTVQHTDKGVRAKEIFTLKDL